MSSEGFATSDVTSRESGNLSRRLQDASKKWVDF